MMVIVDYGLGNLGSIANMFKKVGHEALISSDPDTITTATKIVLPGVGAFDRGMDNLRNNGLISVLQFKVEQEKVPVLGICLGLQLMAQESEEGKASGLGWIKGRVKKFNFGDSSSLKIPHMGWNEVQLKKQSALFSDFSGEIRFYFAHSYYLDCDDINDEICSSNYGYSFTSGIQKANIFGVQFHPEKSHRFGMKVLKNFAEYT